MDEQMQMEKAKIKKKKREFFFFASSSSRAFVADHPSLSPFCSYRLLRSYFSCSVIIEIGSKRSFFTETKLVRWSVQLEISRKSTLCLVAQHVLDRELTLRILSILAELHSHVYRLRSPYATRMQALTRSDWSFGRCSER
jgi:hypothetical protein